MLGVQSPPCPIKPDRVAPQIRNAAPARFDRSAFCRGTSGGLIIPRTGRPVLDIWAPPPYKQILRPGSKAAIGDGFACVYHETTVEVEIVQGQQSV